MVKKNILIIDDSALMRRVISDIMNSDSRFEVVDTAENGMVGYDKILKRKDLNGVILDINMPKMNGLEMLEKLQAVRCRVPIVLVSTVAKPGVKEVIRGLELGAFDFVTKPDVLSQVKSDDFKDTLIEMMAVATHAPALRAVHEKQLPIPDNTRRKYTSARTAPSKSAEQPAISSSGRQTRVSLIGMKGLPKDIKKSVKKGANKAGMKKLIALACSTGGPKSLQEVIPHLPANLDAPLVIVQHMPAGFTLSLAQRLDELSKIGVKEAEDGDILRNGMVYIAKGGCQLHIVKAIGNDYKIVLKDDPPIEGLRPCANVMYESLMDSAYDEITCVVLTGMGADGTLGIKELNRCKENYIISQDEKSCVVYGMPKAIADTGLVDEVVPLNKVADAITKNVGVR